MIASFIDHTLLKADATQSDIRKLCEEAYEYGFFSVCVNPIHVEYAANCFKEWKAKTQIATVVGFPLGATLTEVKCLETTLAVSKGASEIDMVLNIGALKEQRDEVVFEDIKKVVKAAAGLVVKVILETCYLTEEEIVRACHIAEKAGASFVKTSTGFGSGGATVSDVSLMKQSISEAVKVKASGGIRDYNKALEMIKAGAERLGTSASVFICEEEK